MGLSYDMRNSTWVADVQFHVDNWCSDLPAITATDQILLGVLRRGEKKSSNNIAKDLVWQRELF